MPLGENELRDAVAVLVRRPGHEAVRHRVADLLEHGLGVEVGSIRHEKHLPRVRGFVDALVGRTVFEFKSDLRREQREAERQLGRSIQELEQREGERYLGIATDGATFQPYRLRAGKLVRLEPFTVKRGQPEQLLRWLDHTIVLRSKLPPEPETVQDALGRESIAWQVAREELAEVWESVAASPSVQLKRELWARMLEMVYGSDVNEDDLFFQHTYLTTVAKTLAARVLNEGTTDPKELLSGQPFSSAGIHGALEPDFFDWPLEAPGGEDVIRRIMAQADRFDLSQVHYDVLKGLYESLIDPEQRHDLGEYYTPDWLAERMCRRVITDPLRQRVLDPACGSGTFLFHAVRRFLEAAEHQGWKNRHALESCTTHVRGIDVHPVAVTIARVTYLLALGEQRLRDPYRPRVEVPVYLGDSLQWHRFAVMAMAGVEIQVPDGPVLRFPASVAEEPGLFARIVEQMLARGSMSAVGFDRWLQREGVSDEGDRRLLVQTFLDIRALQDAGRNHIWGYVARNQARPVWLSSAAERSAVVIGNPPWLSFRYMNSDMQQRFRDEGKRLGLWKGGKVATHQDLSGYFFARCVELYLAARGTIAFVMPRATLSRQQFAGLRTGVFGKPVIVAVRYIDAWDLDGVQPLFNVPACVLIAQHHEDGPGPLPGKIEALSGQLPKRDVCLAEAETTLQSHQVPWPIEAPEGTAPYQRKFRQGATVVPRRLFVVERDAGSLGVDASAPAVRSRESRQDKPPWKDVAPLRGRVEADFLRPLYLGESVAPFRLLEPSLAVIPWDSESNELIDAARAHSLGYPDLGRWLEQAEELWNSHSGGDMSLVQQLDYYGKLSSQFPIHPTRLLYTKAGTLPAAAILQDPQAIVDHKLYWAPADIDEARYLEALLNSDEARRRLAPHQSRGQWGPRDIDKYILRAIRMFDPTDRNHRELVKTAREAEEIAARVELEVRTDFRRARQRIRKALEEHGLTERLGSLATKVLT